MKKLFLSVAAAALVLGGLFQVASADEQKAQVGTAAPAFSLKGIDGKDYTLESLKGKVVVLEWFNPDCPYVKKHHVTNKTMQETAAKLAEKGVVWLAINSGAEGKQGAGPERNKRAKEEYKVAYPILLDMDGKVGRAYGAKATPTMVVIDAEGKLAYVGAIDDDASPKQRGAKNYVALAVEALLEGKPVAEPKTRAYG